MVRLINCPTCERHVRNDESACPFCECPLDEAARRKVVPDTMQRLSRAAMFMFGTSVAMAGATAGTGCGDDVTTSGDSTTSEGGDGSGAFGATDMSSSIVAAYGTPGVGGFGAFGGFGGDGAFGGDASGGDAPGGNAQGGDAQGGDAQGGNGQGGDAPGGNGGN